MKTEMTPDELIDLLKTIIETNEYGSIRYKLNGKLHRVYGPAMIYANGTEMWYINGKKHRVDGPAMIYTTGDKEWFIDGKEYTKEEFNAIIKNHDCVK